MKDGNDPGRSPKPPPLPSLPQIGDTRGGDLYLANLRRAYRVKADERRRNRRNGVLFIIGIILILALTCAVEALRAEPGRPAGARPAAGRTKPPATVAQIEAAIISSVKPYPKHPVVVDGVYRLEIANAIAAAGRESNVPELFLVALFQRESSFRRAVVEGRRHGKLGESGLGQLHGVARAWCKRTGFNLKTIDGQARCSAGWLSECRTACGGSLKQGFAFYATGRTCDPRRAGDVVKDRHELWQRLEREAGRIP